MSEESLEVCQEATLCVPPPSATREKEEEEGGENSICISFHRNVGQGFGVSANWKWGHGGGALLSIQPRNVGVDFSQWHMRSLCFPESEKENVVRRPGPRKDTASA